MKVSFKRHKPPFGAIGTSMNGIEKIIEFIKSESAAECEAIEAAAVTECGRIREKYAKSEQDEYWRILNTGTKDAELRLKRLNGLARLQAKKRILATQQEMISHAFNLAVERLLQLSDSEYIDLLARLARDVSLTGEETIILSPSDYRRIGEVLLDTANSMLQAAGKPASLTLSKRTANIHGGFIMTGGNIDVNCSIDALVDQHRHDLAPLVASVLFD